MREIAHETAPEVHPAHAGVKYLAAAESDLRLAVQTNTRARLSPRAAASLLAEVERLREDAARLDMAQRLLYGADFDYGEHGIAVVVLEAPCRVGASFRAFLDAARLSTPDAAIAGERTDG